MTTPISVLAKKLLIKPGQRVVTLNAPPDYAALLTPLPQGARVAPGPEGPADAVHLFVRDAAALSHHAAAALALVGSAGLLWIVYPKGGRKAGTDLNRDTLRVAMEEAHGWTAVTQVAVDDAWSALRFRPADRVGTVPSRPSSRPRLS